MDHSRRHGGRFRPPVGPLYGVIALSAGLAPGCAIRGWHATPLTQETVHKEATPKRTIRVATPTGNVLLDVVSTRYPMVEGRAHPGDGEVLLDVAKASRAESVAGALSTRLATHPHEMRRAALIGKLVRFHTEAGPVMLNVTSFEYPLVRGRPGACPTARDEEAPCPGLVHLDLREASGLEVLRTDLGKSFLVNCLVLTITWGVLVLIYIY